MTATGVGDNVHRFVNYSYDPDGNRSTIQYPSGTMLDYSYTQRNQVASITLDGQQNAIVSYLFDPSGNITSRSLENGTSTAYTVDQVNRDSAVAHSLLPSGTKRFDYAYNNVNDILAVQRDGNSSDGDGYAYDLTQQITTFAQNGTVNLSTGTVPNPQTNNTMQFDGCGNRTNLNGTAETFNNMNQPNDVPHDTEGNVQIYNGFSYTYDAQNRLREALNSSTGTDAHFYYDGLNRQIARVVTAPGSSPTPTPTPSPTPTATPSPSPTPTPTPTPTATPTPPPNKVATPTFNPPGENIYPATSISVTISTTTTGAQIRYTLDGTTPTETYGTLINGSSGQTSSFNPGTLGKTLNAIAFKSGMTDSDVESEDYTRESGGMGPMGLGGGTMTMPQTMVTTTIYSVWDGDWAILEEYDSTGSRVQGYVQGYHGLVKTLVDNIYYYQDELGSTSHIADSTGQLLEYYKYDLYGKPTYFDSTSQQLNGSTYGAAILGNGGSRWMPELWLYDSRNRFMTPDLGRFLQPDPIGFKGDASNLYRYCGNDWANRSDPTGLIEVEIVVRAFIPQSVVFPFRGDNRTFSPSSSASSRISVTAHVETDPSKNHGQVLVGKPTFSISPTRTVLGGEKTADGPMLPKVGAFRDSNGNVGITVHDNVRNPFTPSSAPGIRQSLSVGVNPDASKGAAKGTVSADPSHEVNITPQGRSTTNIPLLAAGHGDLGSYAAGLMKTAPVNTGPVNLDSTSQSNSGTDATSESANSVEPEMTNVTNDSCPAFPHLVAPAR